jgi:hypothetical protein
MDTPEQAKVRQMAESERGKEYEVLYFRECAGGWEAFLRRKVGKTTYEVVCDAVYQMGTTQTDQAIVSSFFYLPNSRPPYTYHTHNKDDIQEFMQILNQTHFPNEEEKLQYIRDWLTNEPPSIP